MNINSNPQITFEMNTSSYLQDLQSWGLTTVLLITVVPAVVVTIANRPQRHTTVVSPAVKLCMIVTSISWSHYRREKSETFMQERYILLCLNVIFRENKRYSLHSSRGSSELSPQSSSTSHFQACGMQRPFRHLNCPGRHVLAEQWAGSSSE